MNKNLLDETLALLERDKGGWRKTADDTGLSYDWLSSLSQGRIGDPGIKRIQKLNEYLKSKLGAQAA